MRTSKEAHRPVLEWRATSSNKPTEPGALGSFLQPLWSTHSVPRTEHRGTQGNGEGERQPLSLRDTHLGKAAEHIMMGAQLRRGRNRVRWGTPRKVNPSRTHWAERGRTGTSLRGTDKGTGRHLSHPSPHADPRGLAGWASESKSDLPPTEQGGNSHRGLYVYIHIGKARREGERPFCRSCHAFSQFQRVPGRQGCLEQGPQPGVEAQEHRTQNSIEGA